jgi:psiF repeat
MIKPLATAAALVFFISAYAQSDKQVAQQERMKSCNTQASSKELKGDDRRDFMSKCLKGEEEPQLTAQQEKMKTCNREASDKNLKGDKRQDFMSDCLRAEAKSARRTSAAGGR